MRPDVRPWLLILGLCLPLVFLPALEYRSAATSPVTVSPVPLASFKGDGSPLWTNLASRLSVKGERLPVLVARFDTTGLAPAYRYLAETLPTRLIERLSILPDRDIPAAEQEAFARRLLETVQGLCGKDLATAVEQRAQASLRGVTAKEMASLEASEAKARELHNFALSRSTQDLQCAPRAGFVAAAEAPAADIDYLIREGVVHLPARSGLFQRQGTWYLVGGVMSSVGDFIHLRLVVDHCLTGQRLVEADFDFSIAEAKTVDERLADAMAKGLYGYVPARLEVDCPLPGAAIYLSPEIPGGRGSVWPIVPAGTYRLRVEAPGYKPWGREIEVKNDQVLRLDVAMVKREAKKLRIEANVPASVWEGAEFRGFTPFELAVPEEERFLVVKADGYQRQVVRIGPASSGTLVFTLRPDGIKLDDMVDVRRNRVYESLGAFALSLIVPIVADGLLQNEIQEVQGAGGNLGVSTDRGYTYYYLRNVGIVVSIALFADTAIKVFDYVETAGQLDYGTVEIRESD